MAIQAVISAEPPTSCERDCVDTATMSKLEFEKIATAVRRRLPSCMVQQTGACLVIVVGGEADKGYIGPVAAEFGLDAHLFRVDVSKGVQSMQDLLNNRRRKAPALQVFFDVLRRAFPCIAMGQCVLDGALLNLVDIPPKWQEIATPYITHLLHALNLSDTGVTYATFDVQEPDVKLALGPRFTKAHNVVIPAYVAGTVAGCDKAASSPIAADAGNFNTSAISGMARTSKHVYLITSGYNPPEDIRTFGAPRTEVIYVGHSSLANVPSMDVARLPGPGSSHGFEAIIGGTRHACIANVGIYDVSKSHPITAAPLSCHDALEPKDYPTFPQPHMWQSSPDAAKCRLVTTLNTAEFECCGYMDRPADDEGLYRECLYLSNCAEGSTGASVRAGTCLWIKPAPLRKLDADGQITAPLSLHSLIKGDVRITNRGSGELILVLVGTTPASFVRTQVQLLLLTAAKREYSIDAPNLQLVSVLPAIPSPARFWCCSSAGIVSLPTPIKGGTGVSR
jgi:hypothetical protein